MAGGTLEESNADAETQDVTVIVQFYSPEGEATGPSLDIPAASTPDQLAAVVNGLVVNDDPLPYTFFLRQSRVEVVKTLASVLESADTSTERVVDITFQPQSVFRVRSVTRCTASLPGHAEAILATVFSPNSSLLASGSGDTTVRIWQAEAQLPHKTLVGHSNWVLAVAFSPDGSKLASASMDASVRVWNPLSGDALGKPLVGHKKWVTSLAWEPYHLSTEAARLVSGSKDGTLRVWHTTIFKPQKLLAGHTAAVTCVRWSGEGLIYSTSQDRTIKVWDPSTGSNVRSINSHGHWVNTVALSTDYVLRCGAYRMLDDENHADSSRAAQNAKLTQTAAQERYDIIKRKGGGVERMVSGSDDFTLMLWEGVSRDLDNRQPVAVKSRMTGHQQLVNDVCFSPDGVYIASASFDKSVRLWDGATGKFLATFRGHVGAVYRVVWSADSRLLLSASKDSTCKVWDTKTRKLKTDLPGHADEVYAVDWSTDGRRAATAGKDKTLKIWHY